MSAANGAVIHQALNRFLEAAEGARRFHADIIGKGVDPDHCLADWLCLARELDKAAIEKKYWSENVRKHWPEVAKALMLESSGTQGGYTVPPDLALGMMRDFSTGSLLRRHGAYVHPMKTLQCNLPIPDISTAQSAGVDPYLGGFQMTWGTPEDQALAQTGMNFRDVVLTAWPLGGVVYASNTFLADAVGVEAWLTRLFGNGAAWYQDYAFFQGNGVSKPQGMIAAPGAVKVTRGTGGAVKAADVQSMMTKMLPSAYDDGLVWFCHPTVIAQFNNTNFPGWVANYDLQMYGRPIIPTGKCSTLGTQGDLILAAPSLYIIGERLQFEIMVSPEEPTGYKNNQSAIRVYSRVDGQPATAAPITLADGSSTAAPFVVLV